MTPEERSDFIYSLACQYNLKERAVRELCCIAEIDYPPEQSDASEEFAYYEELDRGYSQDRI